MKNFKITYESFAGKIVETFVDATNEDDAINIAYNEDCGYSNDNILKIISVEEI